MKRSVLMLLAAALFLGSVGLIAYAGEGDSRATHVPFAEYATATWCGYCKYGHGALKQIYAAGNHEFYYVTLITDKNSKAQQRVNQYNVYGYPTAYFDGGSKVNVGAGSIPSAKAAYNSSLTACESRPVNDIDVEVVAQWFGDATMSVCAYVTNNEPGDYNGRIRVYVTEIESSMNWKDTTGKPYTFAFLDFAMNETLSIPSGDTWALCVQYDGKLSGYNNIQPDNIMVIGAVFDDTWHQGYSYPPSSNPFDAYYVDDTDGTMPDTLWPDIPFVQEAGGTVNFFLKAGINNANRNYLVVGGVTGTDPGTALPGGYATLPVNWDFFSDIVMSYLNSSIFTNFASTLDANGEATAQLNVPPIPGSAGLIMHYAFCCNAPFDYVSNPVEIEVIP